MAKAQKKPAAKAKKPAAKKVAAKGKKAAKSLKTKVAPKKKPAKPAKPAKKPPAKKTAPKKAAAKGKQVAKAVKKGVAKVAAPAKKVAAAPKPAPVAAKPAKAAAAKPAVPAKPAAPPPPAAKPAAASADKKRGRRARPRVHSSGVPVAAWLSTEKPRASSFIPAPPRAEAPSAIAAPPASSDRLIRPDDVLHPAVRTVPVRIDIEQGVGRFHVIASPVEVTVRVTEGIEWDFRYVGGADVMCDEIVIEFEKPSPFPQSVYRSRRPGGARPHRQLSGPASAASAGKRVQYTARAMTAFKTELAATKLWVTITA
jgi:hypothetical protein